MRTMKNAVQELVIELDAAWMEESPGGYAYNQLVAEPKMLAWWAGITEGTGMTDLLDGTPTSWTELSGKDGGTVWYRGIPQGGPGALIQVSRANPATGSQFLVELDEALAA